MISQMLLRDFHENVGVERAWSAVCPEPRAGLVVCRRSEGPFQCHPVHTVNLLTCFYLSLFLRQIFIAVAIEQFYSFYIGRWHSVLWITVTV